MRSSVQYSWWKLLEMVAWPLICLFVLAGLLLLWRLLSRSLWLLTAGGSRSGNSPFVRVFPPSPPPQLVTAHGERDRVLKQSFSVDKIPDSLDAIVIGVFNEPYSLSHTCMRLRISRRRREYKSCAKRERSPKTIDLLGQRL